MNYRTLRSSKARNAARGEPKHPSSRPSRQGESGFATDAPSADEILEAGDDPTGASLKKVSASSSFLPNWLRKDPEREGAEVAKRRGATQSKDEREGNE